MPRYVLDGGFVERLRAVVRWFENSSRNEVASPGRTSRKTMARPAIVTTEIQASTDSNMGNGQAKLKLRDPVTGAMTDMPGQTSDTVTVKVWSWYTGKVAVGKRIYVIRAGADWELLTADCP